MRARYLRAALCCGALVAAACDDLGTGSGGEGGAGVLGAPASMDRFDVDVRASGSFRPGQPVQITLTARANLRTSDAEVRLVLPEVAGARESSWERPQLPHGRALTPDLSERVPMTRGQSLTRTANVVIPRPGYYQVVASAVQRSAPGQDEATPRGENEQNVAHDEVWIWIAESGGRVTERFDPSLFPAGTWQVPGPLTPTSQPRPGASTVTVDGPRPAPALRAAEGPRASHTGISGYVDSHVMYYNNDTGGLAPIPNAKAEYTIYSRTGALVRTETKVTDAEGNSWVACYSDANGWGTYRYRVLLDNDRVGMEAPVVLDISGGDFSVDCGKAYTDEVPSTQSWGKERAHVYVNLDKGIRKSDEMFGIRRARIIVRLDGAAGYSTYDWNGSDRLIIDTQPNTGYGDQVWGTYGAFVHMHEYGHAYHETALGGAKRYYSCPNPHHMYSLTTWQCALAEGFPDYYAVATMGSATGALLTEVENGRYSPSATNQWGYGVGTNGAKIEGAVASFFYDLTDPANETHDETAYPGRYVADIVRTCEVYLSSAWRLNDGVDHLVYCFQGTIDNTAAFQRTAPTSFREAATEPEAYETRYWKIRRNYRKNLFGYDN